MLFYVAKIGYSQFLARSVECFCYQFCNQPQRPLLILILECFLRVRPYQTVNRFYVELIERMTLVLTTYDSLEGVD